jgi:FO synthase
MQPFADKRARKKDVHTVSILDGGIRASLRRAEHAPSSLSDETYAKLLSADGSDLDALCVLADAVRHDAVGDEVTFVINRNIDTTVVGRGNEASRKLVEVLTDEAWRLGATEICMQGPLPFGAPDNGYLALVGAITARAPAIHLHAFRPAEIFDGATRLAISPREFLETAKSAGLGSVPGTAARILNDEIRAVLLDGPDLPVATWINLIITAHEAGLRSTATMVYGHVETPAQQVAHLRTLATIQDRTGGFTEFIPMPYVPQNGPAHLLGVARPGPTMRETRALHAVARLMLHGRIDHVQAAWTKLGTTLSQEVLCGGADDLGGLLLDGELSPSAGQEAGLELTITDVERLSNQIGRTTRQRTTCYGDPALELAAAELKPGRQRANFNAGTHDATITDCNILDSQDRPS